MLWLTRKTFMDDTLDPPMMSVTQRVESGPPQYQNIGKPPTYGTVEVVSEYMYVMVHGHCEQNSIPA